jgi:hypothetical protein
MYSSAPAMSYAPEELVGHVNRLQRSQFFAYFRLEQEAHQLYISTIHAAAVKESNRRIHREMRPAYWHPAALDVLPVGRLIYRSHRVAYLII